MGQDASSSTQTQTACLIVEIQTQDIYKDMEEDHFVYETSDYPKQHRLYSEMNKKVLGKMGDECAGTQISECVCLRPKMYSILKPDEKNIKKAKGVKKNVVKKNKARTVYVQGNGFRCGADVAWDEYSKKRGA